MCWKENTRSNLALQNGKMTNSFPFSSMRVKTLNHCLNPLDFLGLKFGLSLGHETRSWEFVNSSHDANDRIHARESSFSRMNGSVWTWLLTLWNYKPSLVAQDQCIYIHIDMSTMVKVAKSSLINIFKISAILIKTKYCLCIGCNPVDCIIFENTKFTWTEY